MNRIALRAARALVPDRLIRQWFFEDLVARTENFGDVRWLGRPVWQNVLDAWTIQEVIAVLRPALLIETGTYRGGSAFYFASLMDLLDHGQVVTIDVEAQASVEHSRVEFLVGSSIASEIVGRVRERVEHLGGPVMVILDSDHTQAHVAAEMEAYGQFVTPGSWMLVQDGVIDELPMFAAARPGPVPAIRDFLARHPEFAVDEERSRRFLVSHHPHGWLVRR
jgi:cephalosporin hydroxylase